MVLRASPLLAILLSAVTLSQTPSLPPSPGGDPLFRVAVASPSPLSDRGRLERLGYDVSCLPHGPGHFEAVVSAAELAALQAGGFTAAVLETAQPLADVVATEIPAGYRDLPGIEAAMAAFAQAHPTLAVVVDISTVFGPGPTVEGRTIKALKISDNAPVDEDEPNVLFASCHHCREIVTPEISLDIMDRLLTGYGVDPAITAAVNSQEIWLIPVQNPDGLAYTWSTNNLWRKNRAPNQSGSFGVDLNRNYALGWSSNCSGSTSPTSETYKGVTPESELETQTMVAFSRARRFAKVMDYHSTGREVLLGYLCSPLPAAQNSLIDSHGVALSQLSGYDTREPSAEGEHQQWQIREQTSYAFLTETATSFQPTYQAALAEANLTWTAALQFLSEPIPLTGRVTNAVTGAPLVAQIDIAGAGWAMGETRHSESRFGRYSLFVPTGLTTLTVSAPGYLPSTQAVSVSPNSTALLDVALTPGMAPFTVEFSTSGAGQGDLRLGFDGIPSDCNSGYTLISFATTFPVGTGPALGLWPDTTTFAAFFAPLGPGSIFHWTWPVVGLFPAIDLDLPPGSVLLPLGQSVDALGIAVRTGNSPVVSPIVRATF